MKPFIPIHSEQAPQAIGCYSQAVRVGDSIWLSGQIGLNPVDGNLAEGFEAQCHQIFQNIHHVLKADQCDLHHIVKLTIYVIDMAHFPQLNSLMMEYITEPYPARAVIGVKALPKNALVEIECIAHHRKIV